MTDASFTDYPPSSHAHALSPGQISLIEPGDLALPSDSEAAEALGMQLGQLSDEIRDEERQRHPEVPMNDEDPRE